MKIVIIGAGEVGFHVAKSLSELDYDISVIDIDHKKCSRANEHLDVIVNQGNGSDEKLLKNINVADADYVFCLTNSDETNLISSLQCHNLGAKKIIARLRDLDYSRNGNLQVWVPKHILQEEKLLLHQILQLMVQGHKKRLSLF